MHVYVYVCMFAYIYMYVWMYASMNVCQLKSIRKHIIKLNLGTVRISRSVNKIGLFLCDIVAIQNVSWLLYGVIKNMIYPWRINEEETQCTRKCLTLKKQ